MTCKVIATSFNERQLRTEIVYPEHPQEIKSKADALEMLKTIVEFEKTNDAGVPLDLIIINSDTNFKEGNVYIESLNGMKTKNGKIIAHTRPNIGWSFGSYNYAFKTFQNDYKYWIFTEDDILVGGKNYAKKLIKKWERIAKATVPIGFLALIGVIRHPYGIHCGGGIGMTTIEILREVEKKFGELPHHTKPRNEDLSNIQNRQSVIINGEVAFTNKIDELGFYLFNYGENKSWDMKKNLCMPYYYA